METIDAENHRATMQASGTDRRGQGGAKATIVSSVASVADGQSRVDVSTDYHITGRLARFGRGGMIEEISNRLLGEFAKNLQAMLAGGQSEPTASEAPPAEAPRPRRSPRRRWRSPTRPPRVRRMRRRRPARPRLRRTVTAGPRLRRTVAAGPRPPRTRTPPSRARRRSHRPPRSPRRRHRSSPPPRRRPRPTPRRPGRRRPSPSRSRPSRWSGPLRQARQGEPGAAGALVIGFLAALRVLRRRS